MTELDPAPDAASRLDPLLIEPAQLLICAALAVPVSHRVKTLAELTAIREESLASSIEQLSAAGRVQTHQDAGGDAWVWMTEAGRADLIAHLRALRALLGKVDGLLTVH